MFFLSKKLTKLVLTRDLSCWWVLVNQSAAQWKASCSSFKLPNVRKDDYQIIGSHYVACMGVNIGALQIKGWWESNINAWFQFMYSQKWNCGVQGPCYL